MVYDISFVGNFLDDATLGAGDVVVVLEGAVWQERYWEGMGSGSFVCIWREHNASCFENQELSVVKLKYLFLKTLYEWTLLHVSVSVEGLLDLMDSLYIN